MKEKTITDFRRAQHQNVVLIRDLISNIVLDENDDMMESYLYNLFNQFNYFKKQAEKTYGKDKFI